MIKNFVHSILILSCLLILPATAAEFWIAPDGNDANPATQAKPLASIATAQRQARELRRLAKVDTNEPVRLILRGGVYQLDSPLFFRPEDSGTETSPTLIEAATNEQPVVSGGVWMGGWRKLRRQTASTEIKGATRLLEGWRKPPEEIPGLPWAAQGKVWVADAPRFAGRILEFRQLWVNNRKAIRAREPNGDTLNRLVAWDVKKQEAWIPAGSAGILAGELRGRVLAGRMPALPGQLEMVIDQVWEIAVLRVKSLRLETNGVCLTFQQPESKIEFEHPWPPVSVTTNYQAPFFLANAIEFLDSPGEWFEDPAAGKIYYWPRPGEDLTQAKVVAPALETLVQVTGTLDRPVENLAFRGITFEHATWLRPSEAGHVPLQASMFILDAYRLKPKGTAERPKLDNQAWLGRPPGGVSVINANHISFERCRFEHMASAGLDFPSGTHDDLVEGCVFCDLGGNGIQLGKFSDPGMETHIACNPKDEREICTHETIANNLVTDCGTEDWGCVGIAAGYVRQTAIQHNEVNNLPYTGISLGWGWTKLTNCMRDNVIYANHIHHVATRMGDTAGIYTLSAQPGTVVSENAVSDIMMSPYVPDPDHWFYLYLDEGSSFMTVRDNWCPAEKFLKNANGPGNLWENNGPMVSQTIKDAAGLEPEFRALLSETNNGKMKTTLLRQSFAALALAVAHPVSANAALSPAHLRCEYAVNPMGIDVPNPRLFWTVESKERGQKQTACQILVASSPALLKQAQGDLWDSGKVASDETIQVPYAGQRLKSSQQVFWKVRVWDANGKASAWSKPAHWTMGLLNPGDPSSPGGSAAAGWQAKWTAGQTNWETLLQRREFVVKPGLKRALVNVCGLGQYELTLNGKKAGDDWLSPGWTKYDKTCLYDTRDITSLLHKGKNAAGLFLGNGMYNVHGGGRFTKFKGSFGPLKAIAQIRLEYMDGSIETIGTDDQWRVAPGPITFSSIYGGEDFDARLVQPGWDKPWFDDAKWEPALVVNGPGGELKGLSGAAPPIREFQVHQPVARHTLTNGDIVFDLGQNAAHVLQIRVSGPAGSGVRLLPSELTNEDGSISQSSMGVGRRGPVWCEFTKGTAGTETWSPKFFYVGCRFVQAHFIPAATTFGVPPSGGTNRLKPGLQTLPRVKSLEGVVIHSDSAPVGEFECSNPLFNRIRTLVRWAQLNNMVSVMTDCPHRERLGWLEEDHLNGPALRYEFDLAQLFTKTLNDIADSQLPNGLIPTTAPEYTVFQGGFRDSLEWGAAGIIVPWQQYEFDRDLDLLRRHYDVMKKYVAYLGTTTTNNIVNHGLGDWYDLGPKAPGVAQLTPVALTATAFYFYDTWVLSQIASLLGQTNDAAQFESQAEQIYAAFNREFFDPTNCSYATGSQCANAIPLVMGLVDATNRAGVLDAIVRDVRAHTNALTAGDVGYRYLLRALADGGRSDVIFDQNNQSDKPGYGYQLKKGATSLTEAWNARTGSSQDHFMLGQIQEWFYHDLAGIGGDPAGPGFKKIIINPQPVGDLKRVKAGYDSIRGKIVSDWKRKGEKFTLDVTIPANTTATVFVPARSAEVVTESGKPAAQSSSVKFLRQENGRAVFAVGSGNYEFKSRF